MPLTTCPDCGRKISTAAEACPQCGRPNAVVTREMPQPEGPQCYNCRRPATQRCQCCGEFSCVEHLEPLYRSWYDCELYCIPCYNRYAIWTWASFAAVALVVIGLVVYGALNRPSPPKRKHALPAPPAISLFIAACDPDIIP